MFSKTYNNKGFNGDKSVRNKLIYLLLIFFNSHLHAQNFPFREYNVQDGLPQSQSSVNYQDSRGFMWISTRNGLSRFDGTEFINYFRKDGLPSNSVNTVFEDIPGNVWTLSRDGLSEFNGKGFTYFHPSQDLEENIFSDCITIDSRNIFYLLTTPPLDVKQRIATFRNGVYSYYSGNYKALDTLRIYRICFDLSSDELLILDTRKQLWSWKNELLKCLSSEKYEYIYSERGRVFLREGDNIYEYKNRKIKNFLLDQNREQSEAKFYSTNLGIVDFYNGRNFNRIKLPFICTHIIIDKEGNPWFSSEKNINRLLSTAFRFFTEDNIGENNIWAIAEDKNGHIWLGSLYKSLIEFDGKTFRKRNEYKSLFNGVISFYKGSRRMANGDLWFSTDKGVIIWDGQKFTGLKSIPGNTQICYIYEDPDDNKVMLGTDKGLFIIKNGIINLMTDFKDNRLGVVEGVTKDDSGVYWLSGHNGVVRFDGRTSVAVRETVLPQAYTYTIEKDSRGGIWVTSDEGLYFRRKAAKSFDYGLPEEINRSASSITIMDSTHILVGRVSDICVIDLGKFYRNEKNYFRIYDKTDGFLGNDCLDNGIIKDKTGRFWILTSDKIVVFDPLNLKLNTSPPRIQITGFYYQTDSLVWKPVDEARFFYKIPDNIELSRLQNKIQITFTGISMTNPEKVSLQYRLNGFDDKWSGPSGKRTVVYEKLSPGRYKFQIKATNADGVETIEPLTMAFRVLPSFWQTTLFMILIVFFILIAVLTIPFILLKKWHRRQKEKERLRAELTRLQMSSVLKQFDPHFTFNVISSVGSLIMKGEKETAYEYITKLSALLRTVLSDGSLIIKPLSVELDFVRKYCDLQKLRFKGRFNYNILIGENIDLQRDIPKMTIQTFVENAIKHGFENRKEGGRVDIVILSKERKLEISIIDNGIGRIAAARQSSGGTGYGLKIIRGLFEAMNVHNNSKSTVEIVDLDSGLGPSGTEVKIVIPDDYRFEFGDTGNLN